MAITQSGKLAVSFYKANVYGNTDGKGTYCTTQQEDNATYEALRRGAAAGRLDLKRVAVLRTGANFDRPHPGQTDADEARWRMQMVTATARFLLRHFPARP